MMNGPNPFYLLDCLEALLCIASFVGDGSPWSVEINALKAALLIEELNSVESQEKKRLVHDNKPIEIRKHKLNPLSHVVDIDFFMNLSIFL